VITDGLFRAVVDALARLKPVPEVIDRVL